MTDYYVSPSGSNSNNGLSTLTPWLTLSHANANTISGDRIFHLSGGVWNDQYYNFSHAITLDVYNGASRWVLDYDGTVGSDYFALITLQASNSSVNSCELRNNLSGSDPVTGGRAIVWEGNNVTVDDCYIHEMGTSGVLRNFSGDGSVVSNSTFEHTDVFNTAYAPGGYPGGGWGGAIAGIGGSGEIIGYSVRDCQIFECGGEGVSIHTTGSVPGENVTVEDTDLMGVWAVGIYLTSIHDAIIRRNIVLGTTNSDYHRNSSYCGAGIAQDIEPWQDIGSDNDNHHVYLNLVAYCYNGLYLSEGLSGADISNVHIAHNTLIDNLYAFHVGAGASVSGTNIVEQNASIPISVGTDHDDGTNIPGASGWTFRGNFWSGGGEHANLNSGTDFSDSAWTPAKSSGWQAISALNDIAIADWRPDTQVLGTQYTNPDTGANWTDYEGSTNFREAGALTLATAGSASAFQRIQGLQGGFGAQRSQRLGGEIER